MAKEQLRLLEARIAVLEKQVKFLLRVNGIDSSALREVSNEELLKYYQDAVQLLGLRLQEYPPEVIEQWSMLFCQLSEYEIARLQNIVRYEHTWEPFYHLCVKMMTAVRQHRDFATDLGLQHLYGLLDRSRKNMREIAVLIIKKCPDDLPKKGKIMLQERDLLPHL